MKNLSAFISIPIVIIATLILINHTYSGPEWSTKNIKLLGTTVRIQVHHEKRTVRELAITKVIEEFHRIESKFSPYIKDSELSQINTQAFETKIRLSNEAAELLRFSQQTSQQTEGAFDITYASVGHLYDFRKKTQPAQEQFIKALPGIGINNLLLDEKNNLRFKHPNTKISFGGFAKGYAVKQAIEIIKGYGISNALVTAGGDSMVIGQKNGHPWRTGIKAPRKKHQAVYTFSLSNKAISTSGDYERYFIDNEGDRVHHIVNPSTGKSASDVHSVTVIGNDPMQTDALSTAIFVMGTNKGLVLAENLDDIEVLIIDKSGEFYKSTGFPAHEDFIQLKDDNS